MKQIEAALESVIELEMTKGHLRWKMSDLARKSGVSRPLLYYYLGKDRKSIFKQAVDYYVAVFLDFRLERAEKVRKGQIIELITVARSRLKKNPYFFQFYAKHRFENTEVSPIFHAAEKKYFEHLKASLPPHWHHLTRVMWALVFGLAVQPDITSDDLKAAEKIIRRAWPS
jgi:AcrR family transcriptional regulator